MSSIVISSSSKSFLKSTTAGPGAGAGEGERGRPATRAEPSAGQAAVARVAVTPLRRKLRRELEFELNFEGRASVDIKTPATWNEFGWKSGAGILRRVCEKGKRGLRCRANVVLD